MNDTPETDAKASPHIGFYSCATVPAEFSRKLERERDEAREDRDMARRYALDSDHAYDLMVKVVEKAESERDEAREALDRASLYISNFTGSCPYDLFDIEPHDSPCSEVCDKYANDMHLCWKKHFANKEAAK